MVYKGYELLKAIADGEIREGSRFRDTYSEYIYKRNSFGDLELKRKDGEEFISPDYSYFAEKDINFELIEDEIEKIYCTNNKQGMITKSSNDNEKERELRKYIVNNCKDIDEILQVVKQIDERVKKLEKRGGLIYDRL